MPADSLPALNPRPVSRLTHLAATGPAAIAAPAEPDGLRAAERLRDVLGALGLEAEILADPPPSALHEAERPVLLLGNLANSRCVSDLYYRLLCVTDRCYPGPGGYEVRTLLDPLGTGQNIIHLGYSDAEGLAAGTTALADRLADPLPFLQDTKPTRLPLCAADVESIRATPLPPLAWQVANFCRGDQKGYLAYLTGDGELLSEYHDAWRAVLSCGYERTEKVVQTHLFMLSRVSTWRLLEAVGLVPADLQREIIRFIYGWAESDDGVAHLRSPVYQSPHYPRQNHGLIPALALIYAADYFQRHHPEVATAAAEWRSAADVVFAPYESSWKPVCDGLCHAWFLSQPLIQEYTLLDPEHRHFAASGARLAADCAVAIVNNQGWMPSAGDADLAWAFPGPNLRIAAAHYRDGSYSFVHNRAPEFLRLRAGEVSSPTRAFDIGLADVPPSTPLVTVIPMDPLIYNVWSREPAMADGVTDTPPTVPIETCFDNLAVRTGWAVDDDYLLLDGLGGGSHSYADAASILDYARFGVSCIVCEDNLIWSAPEHHSMVTVTRAGEMGQVPSFASLQAKATDADGNAYLRILLPGCAGADWIRELHMRRGRCLVVHDTVIATQPGSYATEAHFRIPARAHLDGRRLRSPRSSTTAGDVELLLSCITDGAVLRLEDLPIHLLYHPKIDGEQVSLVDDAEALWRLRYQTDEVCLQAYAARVAGDMAPGQSFSLTHLIQIRGAGEPELSLHLAPDGLLLSDGAGEWHLPLEHRPPSASQSRPAAVTTVPRLASEVLASLPAPVTCMEPLPGGGVLLGAEDGSVTALDADAGVLWQTTVEGPVHDLSAPGSPRQIVLVGCGPAGLVALDHDGQRLWQRTIVREPCPWPWWELVTPAPVQVAGGLFAGETLFAVGCGDIQVRLYDSEGNERWMWRYNEGVPGRLRVADVDGDGVPEIVVGGDILSDVSTCRILTYDRSVKAELPVEGWTSCLTALTWGAVNGRSLIACGATRGRNLHLYDITGIGERPETPPEHLFAVRLGGTVTGLGLDAAAPALIAATSQGFLLCFGLDGTRRWSRLLEEGITHLVPLGDAFAVQEHSGRFRLISIAGDDLAISRADVPWHCTCATPLALWFASDRRLRRIPQRAVPSRSTGAGCHRANGGHPVV